MSAVILRILCLLVLGAVGGTGAHAQERIRDYAIEIDVRADGSLDVVEHITVHAAGDQIRRGIYRDFPTRYRDRVGNAVVVDLEVLGVTRDGETEPWFTEWIGNGVRINTGNDDFLPELPRDVTFTLRYRTTRQLGFFDDHDELYWNAIGTGWVFPIDAGRVEVRLPSPVPVEAMAAEGYTGPQGAQGQDYRASVAGPGVARWELTRPLAPNEGLTIVLSFPKGLVPEPTARQRFLWLLRDNAGVLVALSALFVLIVYCVQRWRAVGRDPAAGTIIVRYDPPAERAPAELRYLERRRYDTRCFTGDLLAAAVEGRVAIAREDRMLRKDRWTLERLAGSGPASALATPSALVDALFSDGSRQLELKTENARTLQAAQLAHGARLDERLHGKYFQRNAGSALAAGGIAALGTALAVFVSGGAGLVLIGVLGAAMAAIVIAFAWLVQAPTPEGRRLLDEIEGLRRYLAVAERDELGRMQGPGAPPPLDAQRYERLLPYAVALGVEEAWTKKFTLAVGAAAAAAATAAIGWYRGSRFDDLGSLAKSLGGGLSASIASASTPPGSSSGRGGGGSSGGGGGGGGGGGR